MIYLKELTNNEVEKLLAFELLNREFFEQHVPPRPDSYYSIEGIRRSVEAMHELRDIDEYYLYLVVDELDNIIGRVNVYDIDRTSGIAEIGYRIGKDYTGKGYATEAVRLVSIAGESILGLKKLKATTIDLNKGSERVLQRCGFTKVDILKNHLIFKGERVDANIYMKSL